MRRRINTLHLMGTLLLLTVVAACTTVDLCYEPDHPHRAAITAHYNWGENAADAPAEMNIIAARIYNTWRNHGIADTQTGACRQGLIPTEEIDIITKPSQPAPEEPDNKEDDTTTGGETDNQGSGTDTDAGSESDTDTEDGTDNDNDTETDNETDTDTDTDSGTDSDTGTEEEEEEEEEEETPVYPFKLRAGSYNFITLNAFKGLEIENLQAYLDEKSAITDSLYFHLVETPRDELEDLRGMNMPDFNPKYRYVQNPGRIFYERTMDTEIRADREEVVEFTPTPISKQITIKFNVHTRGDLEIEKMIAEMSGICGRFNIVESYLDTTNLYRLLFHPVQEQVVDVPADQIGPEDNPRQKIYTFSATFHTMGMVPSYRSTYLIGPGILQLAVYAKTGGKRRIFYAGANPRQDLIDAKILRVEEGKTYLRDTDPLTIFLSGELLIDEEEIMNRNEDRFDVWFSAEDFIDVDV